MKYHVRTLTLAAAIGLSFLSCSSHDEKENEKATTSDEHAKKKPLSKFDRLPEQHPEIKMFVYLINLADLEEVFEGTGPFTVFAPSNEAFEKLGKETLDELQKPENRDDLTTLLIYHVIPGKYLSKHLKTMEAATVSGKKLTVNVKTEHIQVNDAKIIKKDLIGPHGVIHVIDIVLLPK